MKNLPEWLKLIKGSLEEGDDGDVDLLISEPIGFDPATYDGISARRFGAMLAGIPKNKKINLSLNTLGGNIGEGIAMYNMILARGNVNTCVVGFAASMGSVIAQAGNKRTMMPGTMMLIHNPMGGADGTAEEIDVASKILRVLKGNLVDVYHDRTGLSKKKLSDMMDATTAMSPKEAKEMGFCDEVIEGSPAFNNFDASQFFNSCRQFSSAPKCAIDDNGGSTATEQKPKTMKLLTAALAKLGLVSSADLTDETAIIADLNTRISPFQAAVNDLPALKTKLTSHEAALKLRVENRVAKAIEAKLVKPERKDNLVAQGIQNEANLDFLDDIAAPATATPPGARRGSPPAPVKGGEDAETELARVRDEMAKEKDPVKIGQLATRARELRGQKNLFAGDRQQFVVIDGKAHPISASAN